MGVVQVGHRFSIQVGKASFCFLSQGDKWAFSACFSFSLLLLFFLGMSFSFYFFCFFGVSLDNLRVISVPEMGEIFSFTKCVPCGAPETPPGNEHRPKAH